MDLTFDTIVTVDWSGGNAKGTKPSADAIWVSVIRDGVQDLPTYFPSRQAFEPWIMVLIEGERIAGRRILLGFDFAFGYPAGATERITGSPDPLAYWDWLEARIDDGLSQNNRFEVAAAINARFDGIGPFWGNGLKRDIAHLPRKGTARQPHLHGFAEKRLVETRAKGAFAVWQLSGAGAVGSQVLMGLPVLSRLRTAFGKDVSVWPFEQLDTPIALIEIWPSLFKSQIDAGPYAHWIADAAQVHVTAQIVQNGTSTLAEPVHALSEGWIFGVKP